MYHHQTTLRVRYGETDQMGYVYYGHYAAYFEVARVEALRSLGLSYKKLEDDGMMLPVLENHSYYHLPAVYDDLLRIEVTIPEMPTVRIKFHYKIYNEKNALLHEGETVLAFIQADSKKPCRPPKGMLRLLEPYFQKSGAV